MSIHRIFTSILFCLPLAAGTIDFSTFNVCAGQSSCTVSDVTVSSNLGTLSVDAMGFGINAGILDPEKDEINLLEVLRVSFAAPVDIDQIVIEKLRIENFLGTYSEQGRYRANGGSWVSFAAQNASGQLILSPYLSGVSTLDFSVLPGQARSALYDFSVHSLDQVPEPATMGLAGTALALLAARFARRRRIQ